MDLGTGTGVAVDGLSEVEAARRLSDEGYNDLPRQRRRTPLRIVGEVVREPMLALLLGAGLVYLLLGSLHEALLLLAFANFSILITVLQETRTEKVLETLRDLTSPRALVIRDGQRKRIPGREVVRGDLVVLSEGDRIPADAVVLDCHDLKIDESLLTGESASVTKQADPSGEIPAAARPGGDGQAVAYSGSIVVRGAGVARIFATGAKSEIGKIGRSLADLDPEPPRLQVEMRRIVRIFGSLGLVVSVAVVLLQGFMHGDWLEAFLAGIALGMAMLPEEFPVVLTVFLAMGAWRISKARVLTRRAAAIESLGAATILCTDKTGTLTQNKMTISELRVRDEIILPAGHNEREESGAAQRRLVKYGVLASAKEPVDPMEKAFHDLGRRTLTAADALSVSGMSQIHAYGLSPDILAVTNVWKSSSGDGALVIAAKGAPEAIADLCRLSAVDKAAIIEAANRMAAGGMRVIGVGGASGAGTDLPDTQRAFEFAFLGLVGLADPSRPGVREAVRECMSAGVRVIMITGDYPATASAIAKETGIDGEAVISGQEFASLSDAELLERLQTGHVFARIMPEQKLRIVKVLKDAGEVVAMTGDGVNDAPALKAAHIGVAMGGRGSDVAREASSIVLIDDDFGAIVKAIRLGRRIYDNLGKATRFIIAVHVPIAALALAPLLTGLPILLGPVHIAFLEMIIDPVCALVFEAETDEPNIMKRPPRRPNRPMIDFGATLWSLLQGAITFVIVAAAVLYAQHALASDGAVRALAFCSLTAAIVALVLVDRSRTASVMSAILRPNTPLMVILAGAAAIIGIVLGWAPARGLFDFEPIAGRLWLVIPLTGAGVFLTLEFLKLFGFWLRRRRSALPSTM